MNLFRIASSIAMKMSMDRMAPDLKMFRSILTPPGGISLRGNGIEKSIEEFENNSQEKSDDALVALSNSLVGVIRLLENAGNTSKVVSETEGYMATIEDIVKNRPWISELVSMKNLPKLIDSVFEALDLQNIDGAIESIEGITDAIKLAREGWDVDLGDIEY